MLNLCGIVVAILKMASGRIFSMSVINSGHHYLPTYQILMISDNVEFLRYYGGHFENGDWQKFFNVGNQFGTSLSTHISNFDNYRTMLNFCGIVATILKMATGRNCSMSGINSGHHYLPTFQILIISENVEFYRPYFMPCFENAELLL